MKKLATLFSTVFGLVSILTFGHQNTSSSSSFKFDNSVLIIEISEISLPTCNGGNNGQVTIQVTGGTEPYSYNWNTFPNQYQETALNLSAGVYFVDVTDAKGNRSYRSVHIENPNSSLLTGVKNQNMDEVDLTTTVTGNGTPFNYSLDGVQVQSYKIADLQVGVHKLVITDKSNCKMSQFIQVFELNDVNVSAQFNAKMEYVNDDGKKISVSKLIVEKDKSSDIQTKIILSKKP